MADIQHFLADRLNLAVSPEKTGVRDASKGSPFLGFHVCAFTLRSAGTMAGRQKVGGGTRRVLRRSTRGTIQLREIGRASCRGSMCQLVAIQLADVPLHIASDYTMTKTHRETSVIKL